MSQEQQEQQKPLGLPEKVFWTAEGFMTTCLVEFVMNNFNGNFDNLLGNLTSGVRAGMIDPKEGVKIAQMLNSARYYFSVSCEEIDESVTKESTEANGD